ncbi:MAG: hypothetical protein KKI12_05245 [Proteobacteria bacterium]|nr:hypothetical protein [Pseudomonadota bacterium]MBU4258681.1 hypothetical protein [Pseudomonadota bacterium]MBU4287562.1 hypothetical protein [Pseudomonadota bacterium]
MMELIATIGQTIAIIAACWAIISGIGAWKREFIGKRRIELAEEVLASFFEIKDSIAFIRNPFATNEEGKSRKKGEYELSDETELLNRGYIVYERYEKKKDVLIKFNTLKYKVMAAFGPDTEKIFIDCNKTLNSIFISARMLATYYWKRQGRVPMDGDQFQKHLDEMQKHEGIFWDMMNETDEIRNKLELIQEQLDKSTKSCFEEPMKTYSIFTKKWFTKG